MFNSTVYNSTVNIKPACSGMLQKSHPKSFFLNFSKNSRRSDWVFGENPCLMRKNRYDVYEKYMDIIVLQVVITGDYFTCEVIDVKEFEDDEQNLETSEHV